MKKSCCIIIPIYNRIPMPLELASINRAIDVFSERHDVKYICGKLLNIENYPNLDVIRFEDDFFKSNKSYSKLLLSADFYKSFMDYEYMLIAQTDSYVLNTDYSLEMFIDKGYDYWGAPWPESAITKPYTLKDIVKLIMIPGIKKVKVGNGGFSLRKIDAMLQLVEKKKIYLRFLWWFNEDLFFSKECFKKGSLASIDEARLFAGEQDVEKSIREGIIPFGVHAYEKYYKELEHQII